MTLKDISINILYVWLSVASTLQTYWNVFYLVRKKETGCLEIDPLIKSQMHGVREPHSTPLLINQY